MDQTVLINSGEYALEIPIINADTGQKDSVFIQPKSRATLPPGHSIERVTELLNPSISQVSKAKFDAQGKILSSPDSYYQVNSTPAPAPSPSPAVFTPTVPPTPSVAIASNTSTPTKD